MLGWWRDGTPRARRQRRHRPQRDAGASLLAALEPTPTRRRRRSRSAPIRCRAAPSSSSRELVGEVRYTEVTERGPAAPAGARRLRDDKTALDADTCRPRPAPVAAEAAPPSRAAPATRARPSHRRRASRRATTRSSGRSRATPRAISSPTTSAVWPCARALPARSAGRADALPGRHRGQVASSRRTRPSSRPTGCRPRDIEDTDYFVCNELRHAALRDQLGRDSAARVERAARQHRAAGLADPRPRSEGRAARAT